MSEDAIKVNEAVTVKAQKHMENTDIEVAAQVPLKTYLGNSLREPDLQEFQQKFPDLAEGEILLACLYNKATREQSIWTKRPLPKELQQPLSEYVHKSSEITARAISKQEFTSEDLLALVKTQEDMANAALNLGITKEREVDSIEPETFILGFKKVLEEAKQKGTLQHPLIIVGLSTHGNIPAYLVREVLSSDNPDLALIKPTSRDQENSVQTFPDDEKVLEKAKPKNILVVDDTIDEGGSMQQALNYLELCYPDTPAFVMVGSARKKPFFAEVEGINYKTTTLEGKEIYTQPNIYRSNPSRDGNETLTGTP